MAEQFDRFVEIVRRLRAPGGCPWDRQQTHKSMRSCLLDETYEFFEAVDENDARKMQEELGDILLQVVLHAQIAGEEGLFEMEDVARTIGDKIIRRHPHVFGNSTAATTEEVLRNWEIIKKEEKAGDRTYIIDGIPESLPALFRAEKMQRRAARVGFDWKDIAPVLDKVEEEFGEFRAALASGDQSHAGEELGDILFALVNVARHTGICAEEALRETVKKFARRFRYIEEQYRKSGRRLEDAPIEDMDVLWEESKKVIG